MKRIVLCADDFGQAPHISKAIIELISKKRLTSVSCMVNAINWVDHAKWLLPYQKEIDIGLHWNLTEGCALSQEYIAYYGAQFSSLTSLLTNSFLKCLNKKVIVAELNQQIDLFQATVGKLPDYIDGHHHIQQFPFLREVLIEVYLKRFTHNPYIRVINSKIRFNQVPHNYKQWVLTLLLGKKLTYLLGKYQIPFNTSFAGVYTFNKYKPYSIRFETFVKAIKDGGIVMCHPGFEGPDNINSSRLEEFHFLNSDYLDAVLSRNDTMLSRFII